MRQGADTMNTLQPAYDLSPLLQVMLMGALVASGPLLWWWLRHRGRNPQGRLQALTLFTLFLTFDLVLFGAFTRLTDSGPGCPDWPGCYGHASPLGAPSPRDAPPGAAWPRSGLACADPAVGLSARRFRGFDRDHEAVSSHRHPAPGRRPGVAGAAGRAGGAPGPGRGQSAARVGVAGPVPAHGGCGPAADGPGVAGRLGQHQLRGAGLQQLSPMPGPMVARDGLDGRL